MASPALVNLKAQRTSLLNTSANLASKSLKTEEARSSYDAIQTQIEDITKTINQLELLEAKKAQRDAAAPAAPVVQTIDPLIARHLGIDSNGNDVKHTQKEAFNRSMASYLKTGKRDIGSGLGDTAGGALVPQEFLSEFIYALKNYAPLTQLVTLNTDGAAPHKFFHVDDTASTMSLVTEGTSSSSTEVDSTQASTVNATDALVSRLTYSTQFADDAFDFSKFLNDIAAARVARALETAITNATDNSSSANALPNSISGGLIGNAPSAGTLAASGTIAMADLKTLLSSVDVAYRANAVFLAHQSVNDFLATLTSTTGELVFKKYDNEGRLLVLGKPLVVNASMKALSSGSGPVLAFGDVAKSYGVVLRDVKIQVVSELPGLVEQNLRSAIISTRVAGTQLVPAALKTIAA